MNYFEDMRGAAEEEYDYNYYCKVCHEWYNYHQMYNDLVCEKCYYSED